MATAYIYTFSKRHNSTAQPTGGTAVDVNLKGGCDLITPIFTLNYSGVPSFNYMSFEGRYYFVTGIRSARQDLWEISCKVDVLATYKSAITGSTQFVLYYSHNNTEIVDNRLSTKTTPVIDSDTETFNKLGSGESYLLTAVGSESTSVFALSKTDVDNMFTDPVLTTITNAYNQEMDDLWDVIHTAVLSSVEEALRAMWEWEVAYCKIAGEVTNTLRFAEDAAQFIKNCYVLPIAKANLGGTDQRIKLGKWPSNSYGKIGFPRMQHDSATVSIPWPSGVSDWRRNSPYTHLYLYIPYIGLIEISPSEVMNANSLTVSAAIDTYSGVTSFFVSAGNGVVIGQYTTNIAAPYAVGAANIPLVESGAQIIASAAAIAGGAYSGNVGAVASGALGIVNALKPLDQSVSSNGGAAGYGLGNTVKIFSVFHDTTVTPSSVSSVIGTPYNGKLSLSGVSGYVQTSRASVAGSMTDTEREEINQLMDGGFFIE